MAEALAKSSADTVVARPLRVLVPLIQEDIKHGREAAERAGMPYYRAAGEKLIEAKAQLKPSEFIPWVTRNLSIGQDTARTYMKLAEVVGDQTPSALGFSSLGDFIRKTGPNPNYNTFASKKPAWQEDVRQVIERVDTETLNLKREELKRGDEREAQRELAIQLIDIGYKVLARTLHPDKGGSRDAMARLNAVRDRLKQNA